MRHQWISKPALRKPALRNTILAGLIAALLIGARGQTPGQSVRGTGSDDSTPAARMYSIVNLGAEAGASLYLNERGQAAFGAITPLGVFNGYFDGDRLHDIGTLGGSFAWIRALNRHGVAVGHSEDAGQPRSSIYAIAWSAATGMRALPGSQGSAAFDINDKGQVVGLMPAPGISARAVRWDPDGSVVALGPLPLSLSEAFAINQDGISTGFGDIGGGAIHAMAWDAAGRQTDIGTLGGRRAFGNHINSGGDVAGDSDCANDEYIQGLFWNRQAGMLPIDIAGTGPRLVTDLNDRGQAVGVTYLHDRSYAYRWARASGVTMLSPGPAGPSYALDINNGGEIAGAIGHPTEDGRNLHAVLWQGSGPPSELNTRLYRVPAGLVLHTAAAINDKGLILAHSNAGLVLLRPGKRGTDAPVLGPVMGMPDNAQVGDEVRLTLGFTDNARAQTHTAGALWSDGCPSSAPAVRGTGGVGEVRLQHRFCAAGYVTVRVRVTDSAGRTTEMSRAVSVSGPGSAALSGKGTLAPGGTAAAARYRDAPLKFALWAPLANDRRASPAGTASVVLHGPFHFKSEQLAARTADGRTVHVEGTGHLDGRPGYRLQLEAHDGGGQRGASADRMRVRVSHTDAGSGLEVIDYDNGAMAARTAPDRDMTVLADGAISLSR